MPANKIITELANIFGSASYADRIPESVRTEITKNGFGNIGQWSGDDLNAVYGALVNMVARQNNYGFEYHGIDLSRFHKGFLAYGDAILDNYVDIATPTDLPKLINAAGDNDGVTTVDPYKIKWADVKCAYYIGTFGLQYQVTTRDLEVKKAFVSDSTVTNFLMRCRSVLPESLKLDRYLIFRNMLTQDAIYKVKKDFQITPASETEPLFTSADAIAIIAAIKQYAEAMQNDTRAFNKLGVMGGSAKSDLVLVINKGVLAALKTALRDIYHNEVDFGVGSVLEIPDFGENALKDGQFACILDERGVYDYDTLAPYHWNIWNGAGLYWNDWLSYQGKLAYALHRNAVKFTLSEKSA